MIDLYRILRPALFRLDPERAQQAALYGLRCRAALMPSCDPMPAGPAVELFGLMFQNRIGLAAGFDKSGRYIDLMAQLGFGFIEIGTVTPQPQSSNPPPNIFRLPEDEALINRMGFPNDGAAVAAARLRGRRYRGICGVNIGKNRDTPLKDAARDYVTCLRTVYEVADYVTVNVSSPNTPGLRDLQHVTALRELLSEVLHEREQLRARYGRRVPLLLKLAPDLGQEELHGIADEIQQAGVDGVIATNTTLARPATLRGGAAGEQGGLSGRPLNEQSLGVVKALRQRLGPRFPIIGVGGIGSAAEARAMREAGADLLQLYTALIYRGPGLVRDLLAAERAAPTDSG